MNLINIEERFAEMVFNDRVMKERLPADVYEAVVAARESVKPISEEQAKVIASAMKTWAIEKGATHFTHWFQPMTGITAEKHDSFIEPARNGDVITKFSEKSLVKGESDASSFPSGGLRATFEARGYTAWDPTSYAFVRDGSLYIPTAFCSFGGQALDKKTPLLRSIEALNREALRVLHAMGNDTVRRVIPNVGAEQEYFLVDKSVYEKRLDLINCGRTLFGARPSKGQELHDHYYGAIKPRVAAFMKEVDEELWKLGVFAKTKHNEAAPAQHELAPVFSFVNVASDQNQLTMDVIKGVASRHGMVCLLHEKPFASVNGSGKHNNWSLSTDSGENLLKPGKTPMENAQFLVFLTAFIKAVDKYQDLLRISISSAGNDHRLGASEAPPAIVSVYLGEELNGVLDALEKGAAYSKVGKDYLKIGVSTLPPIPKDSSDRNRTAPIAFTGNKFEFRMVGSSENIACPNFIINTIVAEELSRYADKLENAKDVNATVHNLIRDAVKNHKRIIFSGNNYAKEWVAEAEKRGLLNLRSTVDALPLYGAEKNVKLFEKHGVLTEAEIASRTEILLENYGQVVSIEALTAIDMVRKEIIPAVIGYEKFLLDEINLKKAYNSKLARGLEDELIARIATLGDELNAKLKTLVSAVDGYANVSGAEARARYSKDVVLTAMEALRATADEIELVLGKEFLPYPNYSEILYSVR